MGELGMVQLIMRRDDGLAIARWFTDEPGITLLVMHPAGKAASFNIIDATPDDVIELAETMVDHLDAFELDQLPFPLPISFVEAQPPSGLQA